MESGEGSKLTREKVNGFDIFRGPPDANGKPGIAYICQDCSVTFHFNSYRIIASTLSSEDAREAYNRSSEDARLRKLLEMTNGPLEDIPPSEVTGNPCHSNIVLLAPLNFGPGISLGLITVDGAVDYEREIELAVRIGGETHSSVSHYGGGPWGDGDGSVYFSVYLSRERMEWLHRELVSRPNAILAMRGKLSAFKRHSEYERLSQILYIECEKSTRLSNVSFDVRDPEPGERIADAEKYPVRGALSYQCEQWIKELSESVKEEGSEPGARRCANAMAHTAHSIAEWCARNGESAQRMVARFLQAQRFLQELDEALHEKDGPFASEKDWLWRHIDFRNFFKSTKPSQRQEFVEYNRFGESVYEYIASPFMQNAYLDWLMVDVMTAHKTLAIFEAFMKQRHGMSYELFEGVWWKMLLWKLIMWPVAFLAGWVLPGVGFYFLGLWSLWLGLALAALYYGFNFWMLGRWLWHRLVALVTGTPIPTRRLLLQIQELDEIYPLLGHATMHVGIIRKAFDRALEKGVAWDQRTFYVLDQVARRDLQIWTNNLPRGEFDSL